jgi:hypothetical protein
MHRVAQNLFMHLKTVVQFGKAISGSSGFMALFVGTVFTYHMNIHIASVEST